MEESRRAQSRGEWPGERRTFLERGLGVLSVGARRVDDGGERLGSGPRGGGIREVDEGFEGGSLMLRRGGEGLGMGLRVGGTRPLEARCAELRVGKEGGGMLCSSSSVKLGMVVAFGVVGQSGSGADFLVGKGGGGIAFRSRSIVGVLSFASPSSNMPFSCFSSVVASGAWRILRISCFGDDRSQSRNGHDVGGCL